MGGFVRGVVIDAIIMGMLAFIGLSLIGINNPLLLSVITMFGEFVPIVGPIIAAVPVVLIALLQSPGNALLALGLYIVLEQVEGHLLTPNIMRSKTSISQVLILFALMAGGTIGGILGALIAIPLAGALRVLVVEVVAPAIRQQTGAIAAKGDCE